MIKIAICDDEKNIRSYLAALIRNQGTEYEIEEYPSARAFLSGSMDHDLIFLDIGLGNPASENFSDGRGAPASGNPLNSTGAPASGNPLNGTGAPASINPLNGTGAPASGNPLNAIGAAVSGNLSDNLSALSPESPQDGMSLARQLRNMDLETQPLLIFVTGYDNYVYDAFDVDAFQYLLKPIDEQRFAEVFQRAVRRIVSRREQCPRALVVQSAGTNKIIPLDSIYYLESRSHKIILHQREGILEYYGKIGQLERELEGTFCRIHKGYLVNLACVEEYTHSAVILSDGHRLALSKYKYDAFVKAHLQYISGAVNRSRKT